MRRGVIIKESLQIFTIQRFYVTIIQLIDKALNRSGGNLYIKTMQQSRMLFLQSKEILSKSLNNYTDNISENIYNALKA